MSWPMSADQRVFIEALRKKKNISPDILDRLCVDRYGYPLAGLTIRDASNLIDALRADSIRHELQVLAGQQVLL